MNIGWSIWEKWLDMHFKHFLNSVETLSNSTATDIFPIRIIKIIRKSIKIFKFQSIIWDIYFFFYLFWKLNSSESSRWNTCQWTHRNLNTNNFYFCKSPYKKVYSSKATNWKRKAILRRTIECVNVFHDLNEPDQKHDFNARNISLDTWLELLPCLY